MSNMRVNFTYLKTFTMHDLKLFCSLVDANLALYRNYINAGEQMVRLQHLDHHSIGGFMKSVKEANEAHLEWLKHRQKLIG